MERLNLDKVKLMAAAATLAMFAGTACAHMEIYGHVNKAFLWTDDGYEDSSIFVDNDYAPSLVGFRASKHLDQCWTFGGVAELEFISNNTRLVSQIENEDAYTRTVLVRKLDSWMSYGQWGTLNLGLGESASWGITNLSYAGTTETSLGSSVADMAGGMRFRVNGNRATAANPSVERVFDALNGVGDTYDGLYTTENRVMFRTGDWMGFNLGVSYGNIIKDVYYTYELVDDNTRNRRQYFDAALRYAHDFCDFKLSAGVAYAHYTRDGDVSEIDPAVTGVAVSDVHTWSGSIAAEHKPTGINAAFAAGVKDKIVDSLDNYKMWYVQLGKRFCLTHYGKTNVAIDYFDAKNARINGDRGHSYGLGVTQDLNKICSSVYASVREYKYDDVPGVDYDSVFAAMVGVKFNFGASL